MKHKRILPIALSLMMTLPALSALSGCGGAVTVLKVYSWEEYIDDGGEGSYYYDLGQEGELPEECLSAHESLCGVPVDTQDPSSLLEDFELFYEHTYGTPIRVEYSTFGTNEDMYNQLKLGDTYDLICPSDYMIQKLAAEDMLEPYEDSFFDETDENNAYIRNVSPFIREIFETNYVTVTGEDGSAKQHAWSDYAAGYMWGTTGYVYNPEAVPDEALSTWDIMVDADFSNKITTKDNVRDSYFVALAIVYKEELLSLKEAHAKGDLGDTEYRNKITEIMNRTDKESIEKAEKELLAMSKNVYSFETDTGKDDLVKGNISLNFAWSGDAVYAMDLAETKNDFILNYFVPEECANLFFDGWVMPKGANKQAAQAFVNFLSSPYNAIRNMYYIGYTSVIATDEVFDYADYTFGVEEEDEAEAVEYDLSYFFGEGHSVLTYEDQLSRQLFAQYPPEDVMLRCAVMDYFDTDTNTAINEMWTRVRGANLEAWAIVLLCVALVCFIGGALLVKFGDKIDFFRRKPKKGYTLVKQVPYKEQ